jgi:hypothetical protein
LTPRAPTCAWVVEFGQIPALLQVLRYGLELFQGGLQVFRDLGGDDFGRREVGGFFKRIVFQPEDVEVLLKDKFEFLDKKRFDLASGRGKHLLPRHGENNAQPLAIGQAEAVS